MARFATVDATAAPFVVPVCFVLLGDTLYITLDAKPKRATGKPLKRVRNILENPNVAIIIDHYDDSDWSQLGWVMLRGHAAIVESGQEHDEAQRALRRRYPQYVDMPIDELPVIAVRVTRAAAWGKLE